MTLLPHGSGSRKSSRVVRKRGIWPFRFLAGFRKRNRRVRKGEGTKGSGGGRRAGGASGGRLRAFFGFSLRLLLACALASALGGGLYGGLYLLGRSHHFLIEEVKLGKTEHVTAQQLLRRAAVLPGENLFRVNLAAIEQRLLGEPWVKSATLRRELPHTLSIDVAERQAAALLSLDALYLCDEDGLAYKRATAEEWSGLVVITGIGRATYLLEPELAKAQARTALLSLKLYQKNPTRPPIGEVHVDRSGGVTLYTKEGLAIRLPRPGASQSEAASADPKKNAGSDNDKELAIRLRRLDAVLRALPQEGQRPVMVFLDNRAHPDHVTVRLAAPAATPPR